MSVGRDGRQGWSRESEAAWLRIFGSPRYPYPTFKIKASEWLEPHETCPCRECEERRG